MAYKPDSDEVFFCGKCSRQQQPSEGERCNVCGKQTVSWYTSRETADAAMRKWKQVNPGG
jgi:rRNA maturation endonuclease Nob1